MAAWILAQNEEHHDVATSFELALVAGFSLSHCYESAGHTAPQSVRIAVTMPPCSGFVETSRAA